MNGVTQYISNKKEAEILVRQLLNIGEAMYCSGGEISRIEDSLHRLGKVYGAKYVSVYAITSSIVITAEFGDDYSITQIRRITNRSAIDCLKMEELSNLCEQCQSNPLSIDELRAKVLELLAEKPKRGWVFIGQFIAALSFTLFFGGKPLDAFVAFLALCIIWTMQRFIKPFCSAELFFNIIVSFVTGIFVSLLSFVIPGLHVNQILIGDIMILIPGIAITNSIRYIFSGDIISSFEKLMDSLLQAFGIATGFMLSLFITRATLLSATPLEAPMLYLVQIIAAAFGTLGFCLAFNMRRRLVAIPALGGLICWACYLFIQSFTGNTFAATLIAAIVVGIYGQIFSGILKLPTTILFIPACVPLIPGGNLYYMALAMISSDWDAFRNNFIMLVIYTVGISLGLAIVGELEKMIINIKKHK